MVVRVAMVVRAVMVAIEMRWTPTRIGDGFAFARSLPCAGMRNGGVKVMMQLRSLEQDG